MWKNEQRKEKSFIHLFLFYNVQDTHIGDVSRAHMNYYTKHVNE